MSDKTVANDFQGLTVDELIEMLEPYKGTYCKVGFAYPYGDYWNNTVVRGIDPNPEMQGIKYSGYHQDFILIKNEDEEEENNDNIVLVLR
jgi:hypothetical protein